ncbi:hypothetical protein JEQ07_24095 [Serratia proteamaculans]|uniref:Uncharacterized protein n=1 Tax=Serratia proteamaculans TaxID=28151 RepID=A0ABS0TZT8_SERPR|nr:hypothetical protein [Serratia proteamaculans]MBI6183464.1 hypothetical protein [Serratia proteamaculans]
MKELNGLFGAALHFAALEVAVHKKLHEGIEVVAQRIEDTAREEVGHYQDAIGPFPAWDPLAPATEDEKARLGYPLDAPLLRTGDMQGSFSHEVKGLEAVIGSTDDKLVYHEFGTAKMPPRPVLGPAVERNEKFIKRILGKAAVSGFVDGVHIHSSLGYDKEY